PVSHVQIEFHVAGHGDAAAHLGQVVASRQSGGDSHPALDRYGGGVAQVGDLGTGDRHGGDPQVGVDLPWLDLTFPRVEVEVERVVGDVIDEEGPVVVLGEGDAIARSGQGVSRH